MTHEEQDDKLPPTEELEGNMPEIACTGCGRGHVIDYQGFVYGGSRLRSGIIQGVLVCHAPVEREGRPNQHCDAHTVFEISGTSVSFAPGRLFEEDLDISTSKEVQGLFQDATRCFYGKSYRGTLGLCRSVIEQALDEKNVPGRDLYKKIQNCPESILGTQEKTWADASRLNGREALHRLVNFTHTQALTSLNLTITLANHIAGQEPLPASQSEPGSNGQ